MDYISVRPIIVGLIVSSLILAVVGVLVWRAKARKRQLELIERQRKQQLEGAVQLAKSIQARLAATPSLETIQHNSRAWAEYRIVKTPSYGHGSRMPAAMNAADQPTRRPLKTRVDCSVFAPPSPVVNAEFVIQAFLHEQGQLMKAAREATRRDKSANRLGFASLSILLSEGQAIELFLDCPRLEIEQPFQSVTWDGDPAFCDFVVRFRDAIDPPKQVSPVLYVSLDGIPIGEIEFSLYPQKDEQLAGVAALVEQTRNSADQKSRPLGNRADRYRKAFVSYSRKDFEKVAFFAEGLSENGIKLFFDVNSIDRGDDWLEEISDSISKTDIFYLMWSTNAAASRMVTEECRLASEEAARSEQKRPKIKPVTLHRQAPSPPEFLTHLHFDSQWLAHREAQKTPLFE